MSVLQSLAISPADALALSMVAILSFALGMIVTLLFVMARTGARRPDIDSDDFADEDEPSHNVEAGDQPTDAKEPWEQDPDWWKK